MTQERQPQPLHCDIRFIPMRRLFDQNRNTELFRVRAEHAEPDPVSWGARVAASGLSHLNG